MAAGLRSGDGESLGRFEPAPITGGPVIGSWWWTGRS